jgi:hypothetical protein
MKKLFIVALIALFVAGAIGVGYAVNPAGPGASGDVMGMQGRYAGDAHRTFRLVRLGAASTTTWVSQSALTAGQLVIWDTTANPYGADGVTVTTTTTSQDSRIAGMIITAVPTPDANQLQGEMVVTTASEDVGRPNWGWLQTYGLSAQKATATEAVVVGNAIAASTTAGQMGPFGAATGTVYSNPGSQGNAGFTEETIAAAGTGYIFLKCE